MGAAEYDCCLREPSTVGAGGGEERGEYRPMTVRGA